MLTAITRAISPAINRCELTHLDRVVIDPVVARQQHERYERCLADAGCTILQLPADERIPDSVFVEDTAIVFDELAVIARPGALSRRVEVPAVGDALSGWRRLEHVAEPGTLDGGDVLVAGRHVFVGRSVRTNEEGINQLRRLLTPGGYSIQAVEIAGCLHLKSAATFIGERMLLINPAWVKPDAFAGFECLPVDSSEPAAANALRIGTQVIYPEAFTRTRRRLERCGLDVRVVDVSELAKAEGGVTCCSLVFEGERNEHGATTL